MRKKKKLVIRDRIKELRRVKASELHANPRNWRVHNTAQVKAMEGILAEIGYAGALLARELPDGTLELIDGHLRAELDPEQEVPVLIVDLDQDEANKLLTVLDPLAAMAETDQSALNSLIDDIDTSSDFLTTMFDDLYAEIDQLEIKQLDVQKPPAMSWVLVGIPTVNFGNIADYVEDIAAISGTIVETTVNNG